MPESAESMTGYQYAFNNPVMYNAPLGDNANKPLPSGAPNGNSGGGSIPNGYNLKGGPGSGDYWSDGIFLGDWSSYGGSNTFRALLAAGFDLRGSDFYDPTNGRKLTVGSNGTYTYADNGTSPPPTEGTALFYGMDGKLDQALPTGSTTSYLEILHKTSDGEYYYRIIPIKTIESAEIEAKQGEGLSWYDNGNQMNATWAVLAPTIKASLAYSKAGATWFKVYARGWTGGSRALIQTIKIARIAAVGGAAVGLTMDIIALNQSKIGWGKFILNQTMSLVGFTELAPISIVYFGVDAFYKSDNGIGWEAAGKDYNDYWDKHLTQPMIQGLSKPAWSDTDH